MRKKTGYIFLLIVAVASQVACNKPDMGRSVNDFGCVKGKVLRENCEGAIIQILTPDLNIGDTTWEDRQGSMMNPVVAVYDNVVNAANICTIRENFQDSSIQTGDTIYFSLQQVEKNYFDDNCIICTGFESDLPKTKVIITSVSKNECTKQNE